MVRSTRRYTALAIAAAIAASCAGESEVYELSPREARAEFALPDPVPAVPAFLIEASDDLNSQEVGKLEAVPGTAVIAPVSVRWLRIPGRRGSDISLKLGGVDPLKFRAVAPAATRDADFVWLSMLTGSAVVSHDAAQQLEIGRRPHKAEDFGALNIGALADNGTPNFVDALVDMDNFRPESWGPPEMAVVGAESGVTIEALGRDVRAAVPDATVTRIRIPRVQQPGLPQPYAAPPAAAGSVAGLHPVLAESVQRLLGAARGRVWIVSGFRTTARQYELWINALAKYGDPDIADNWVAPPGHSFHERGLAVDLGGDVEYAAQLVAQLRLPLWRPMSWEPWHFELVGSRG